MFRNGEVLGFLVRLIVVVVIPPDSKSKSDLGYAGKDLMD
jgi:hypothetical protein